MYGQDRAGNKIPPRYARPPLIKGAFSFRPHAEIPPHLSDPIEGVLSNGDGFHADIRKKEERPLANWTESTMKVAGADLTVVRGGSGKPLLMFHDELGYPGWMTWNEELAKDREIIIPLQPGFGKTPRIEWIRSFRDLGGFYANVVRELNHGSARCDWLFCWWVCCGRNGSSRSEDVFSYGACCSRWALNLLREKSRIFSHSPFVP